MSDGSYADIIIVALIAAFILLRLRSVLGRKNEGDEDFFKPQQPSGAREPEPVILLGEKHKARAKEEPADPYIATLTDSSVTSALAAIKLRDPGFSASAFLDGAKMAFEMVFDAFAKGDKQTLTMLLSTDIAGHFIADIEAREKQEVKSETTLLAVTSKNITRAELDKNMARITVHFESEQVTVERNSSGDIVSGNPSASMHAEDEWVFERDVTSKNPNWKIIET